MREREHTLFISVGLIRNWDSCSGSGSVEHGSSHITAIVKAAAASSSVGSLVVVVVLALSSHKQSFDITLLKVISFTSIVVPGLNY
jgi:hypothetical protein